MILFCISYLLMSLVIIQSVYSLVVPLTLESLFISFDCIINFVINIDLFWSYSQFVRYFFMYSGW